MILQRLCQTACLTLLISQALISQLLIVRADAQEVVPHTPPVLLQMIRDAAVHRELELREEQVNKVRDALRTVDGDWFRARNLPADQQTTEIAMLSGQLLEHLNEILDDRQQQRLTQLVRQSLGTRMVVRDDVATSLGLSTDQQRRFMDAFAITDKRSREIQNKLSDGVITNDSAARETKRLQAAERQLFAERLTPAQLSIIRSLTGPPFDFSKVVRTYPLAPELTDKGVTWIQGGPLKLDELKGKVVAVHFYAFQCINCQRNLPHYKAWHKDYADQGLVVIGIQTPETAAERQWKQVKTAVFNEAIEYPVMLDADAQNWKTWGNTMWPTVYLIDKEGFLRRWWQGELNWKGGNGEQQLRATIEQLLAE